MRERAATGAARGPVPAAVVTVVTVVTVVVLVARPLAVGGRGPAGDGAARARIVPHFSCAGLAKMGRTG